MRASAKMVIERSNQEQKKYSFYGDYPGRWRSRMSKPLIKNE